MEYDYRKALLAIILFKEPQMFTKISKRFQFIVGLYLLHRIQSVFLQRKAENCTLNKT